MATTSLGRLTLDLVAQIGQFVEPLNKAERKARDSAKSISKEFDVATIAVKALGAAAAGLSVASVMNFASGFINSAAEIDRSAKLVGASTQQFQYYAAGAKVAGISLEKFADINKDVNDRLGEARRGEGEMMDFFTKIAPRVGITIDQFKKLSGPEALQLYYNGLQKANLSHAEQITYMEQIANDAGLLIPMLKDGGAGFKEWGDQAQKAGAIMSDDMIKQMILANQNLEILDLKWQGFKATLVNDVMPAFTFVSNNLDNIKAGSMALGAYLVVGMVPAFVKGTVGAISYGYQLIRLTAFTGGLAASTTTLKTALSALGGFGGLGFLALQGLAAGAAFLFMKNKSEDVTGSLNIQGESVDDLISKYEKLNLLEQRNEKRSISQTLEKERVAYVTASSDLSAYIEYMKESGLVSEDTGNKLQLLYNEYAKGNIDAVKFSTTISNMTGVQQKQKDEVDKLTSSHVKAKTAFDKTKQVQEQLKTAHEATTKAVKAQKDAYADLSEKQKQALMDIDKTLKRQQYISEFVKAGGSRDQAEAFASYREKVDMGFNKPLTNIEVSKIRQGEALTNYSFSRSDREKIAGAIAFVTANSLEDVAKNRGIPSGLITGLIAQESGGKNLTSPTGATGELQTTAIFRKQHAKTLKAGNYSPAAFTQAASDELIKAYREFGNWVDAIMAYNGGVAGVKAFKAGRISENVTALGGSQLINGQLYLSPAKAREMQNYPNQVLKYQAGAGGSTKVDQSMIMPSTEDLLKLQNDAVQVQKSIDDKKKELDAKYFSDAEKLAYDHQERLKQLNLTFTGDELKNRIAKENALYKDQSTQLKVQKEEEYASITTFETDRILQIEQNYKRQIELAQNSVDLDKKGREDRISSLQRARDFEIASIKLEQKEQILSANEVYMSETEVMLRRYEIEREQIKLNKSQLGEMVSQQLLDANQRAVGMALDSNRQKIDDIQYKSLEYLYRRKQPNQAAFTDLQNQYVGDQGALSKAYSEQRAGIFAGVDDEVERNAQLLSAHEDYLQARAALSDEYAQREKDLVLSQHQEQLNLFGGILSNAQNTFAQLTQSAKDGAGEQSSTYRTMFALQQGFSVASSLVAAWTAYTQAFADPSAMTLPQKFAGATAVMAALAPALATISSVGFSGGGYTGHGGKYDPAGIVHKGEGVLTQEEIAALGGPTGFEYLRKAIRTGDLFNNSEILASETFMNMAGYSSGGIVGGDVRLSGTSFNQQFGNLSRSGEITQNLIDNSSGQSAQPQTVENVVKFIMVKDEEEAKEHLYSKDGEKAWLYHFNRNKSKVR